jgi:hypothetical protein
MGQEFDEEGFLASGGILQKGNQFGNLLLAQRQRRDTEGGTFGDMGTVGFKHGDFLTFRGGDQDSHERARAKP